MNTIFDYLDYRQYLRDEFQARKKKNIGFSHRNLMRRLSLHAPGHMLFVMQGKRRLTQDLAIRLAAYLKLNKKETDYLLFLIRYSDAKTPANKQYAFEELVSLRERASIKPVPSPFRFYEKWYYSAVRASLDVDPYKGDYTRLASSICPPITPREAKEAIELLLDLKMIKQGEDGSMHPCDQAITTGGEWQSATITNFHRQFVELGKYALDRFNKEDRDISNCTVTVSAQAFELIKKRIRDLRTQIIAMGCAEQQPDRVLQVNIQVFPIQRKTKGNIV